MPIRFSRNRRHTACACYLALLTATLAPMRDALGDEPSGEQIYMQKCVDCHGPQGQGTENVSRALVGDRPLKDLARLIAETMPEDDPEACVGPEAERVAAYIYDAFYSKLAQARNAKPRIELSRLTVRQYRNTVADLIGSFGSRGRWSDQRGLEAEYFNARNHRRDKRVIERRDAVVDFDFKDGSPDPEKIGNEEFSMRWKGSLLAWETGEYEIIVRTENGARLWLNDQQTPLIDAWVKSGDETDHQATIFLIGGRMYPLQLEHFKFKEPSASISLMWKPPHGVPKVIPERNLSPEWAAELLVVNTPFPPDDRSVGYERGSAVSKAWDEATTYAAIEVANHVASNLRELAGASIDDRDAADKLPDFCRRFAERALRRPLDDQQRQFYVDQHFQEAGDLESAVKRSVLLVLKSPRFLYRELGNGEVDAYDVASRISYGLWDSLPDQPLLEAAARNQLSSRDQVIQHAERMLDDPRTKSKFREFLQQWLKVDHIHDLSKDSQVYPDFSETLAADLRTSLELFLDEVVWNEASDFRQLLLADYLYVNGPLGDFYGIELPADAGFQKVSFDPQQRAGILSHPFLLSGFAYHSTSSPIHRGVFIARSLLGRSLRPPPVAVAPLSPELHEDLTTRQRVDLQTKPEACQTCHAMINPLGFTLENFDAVGRYRTEESGKGIDASGFYLTQSGDEVEFQGVRQLAEFLAASDETAESFVEQVFHHLVKQPMLAYGPEGPVKLRQSFQEQQYNIRHLLVQAIAHSALASGQGQ